jgi:hypothetical protein
MMNSLFGATLATMTLHICKVFLASDHAGWGVSTDIVNCPTLFVLRMPAGGRRRYMMRLMHSIGSLALRLSARTPSDVHAFRVFSRDRPPPDSRHDRRAEAARYRLNVPRTLLCRAVEALPPFLRETVAENFLRRAGAPGPAAEHVFQYSLSAARARKRAKSGRFEEATIAKGADNFYKRQYRQFFNHTMGAFAMTAKMALVGTGGAPHGWLWCRCRPVWAAMLEETAGARPIIVINRQTVAVPFLLPKPSNRSDFVALARWVTGNGSIPSFYRRLVAGEEIRCADRGVRARSRNADGALLEVIDGVTNSGKLAVLALHPYDPDAMGLHITLFGAQILTARFVEEDYGLGPTTLDRWRKVALEKDRLLFFCVGGTEEVFTQCSQNLFVKRPVGATALRDPSTWPSAWSPGLSLDDLLNAQFEIFQISVSASGLPGVSPRNGDQGTVAFVGHRGVKTFVLIPYFTGNAVHGHAAKLWSNSYGQLVVWDDHFSLSAVTLSGPTWVISHHTVENDFPSIAMKVAAPPGRKRTEARSPEYWFLHEVVELVQQSEPLVANLLDPSRPTCSIHAGGLARHGKKPAYFAAETLPPYDQDWQHRREALGRPIDPKGKGHGRWVYEVAPALAARHMHLARIMEIDDCELAAAL